MNMNDFIKRISLYYNVTGMRVQNSFYNYCEKNVIKSSSSAIINQVKSRHKQNL